MENVTVSLIIAVYNVEKYLQRCLDSLCGQTYRELEIILVDDGSTDSSSMLCDCWEKKDARIKVIHQENAGVSAARNRGIAAAVGKYVMFVDSDDWVEPDYVEELIGQHVPGTLTLAGYFVDDEGENRQIEKVYSKKEACCHLPQGEMAILYQKGLFSPIWNKLYEREKLLENNISFRIDMNLGEDTVFNLEYVKVLEEGISIVNRPLYHYMRWGNASLASKYNEKFVEMQIIIHDTFLEYLEEISAVQSERECIVRLYFDALVVAMDNLYLNRKKLGHSYYWHQMKKQRKSQKFHEILEDMKGADRRIYWIRYFFLSHGCYIFDYYLRKVVKMILRV